FSSPSRRMTALHWRDTAIRCWLSKRAKVVATVGSSSPGLSPRDLDQDSARDKPSHDRRNHNGVLPLTLGCAQPLDSTLFFRGISFCLNSAGRVQNLTHAIRFQGIKSFIPRTTSCTTLAVYLIALQM